MSRVVPCSPRLNLLHTHEVRRFESSSANHLNNTTTMVYVARRPPQVFRLGRFWGGLVLGRTTFRILTSLVESSDDGMIRRLQLEDFHVSLVGLGVLAGAVVSVWASTFVASLLYGLEPPDTATPAGSAMGQWYWRLSGCYGLAGRLARFTDRPGRSAETELNIFQIDVLSVQVCIRHRAVSKCRTTAYSRSPDCPSRHLAGNITRESIRPATPVANDGPGRVPMSTSAMF